MADMINAVYYSNIFTTGAFFINNQSPVVVVDLLSMKNDQLDSD